MPTGCPPALPLDCTTTPNAIGCPAPPIDPKPSTEPKPPVDPKPTPEPSSPGEGTRDRNVVTGPTTPSGSSGSKTFKQSITVKAPNTSTSALNSNNKSLKNSSNYKSYLAGNTYTKVASSGAVKSFTQPKNGSLEFVSGELRFTPDSKFKGLTTFTYTSVNAAGETEVHEVQINVENKAPILISALYSSTKTDEETWTTSASSLNFSSLDPNGDPVKIKVGTPNKEVRVSLTNGKLTLSAPREFSGHVDVDVTATDNDNGVGVVTARFVVNPKEASGTSLLTVTKELHLQSGLNKMFEFQSIVSFKKSSNAIGLALAVNGVDQGNQNDHNAIVVLPEPVGTKDNLQMKMLGNDSTASKSVKVPVKVATGVPVAHVNFDNDSWALTKGARAVLDELAATAAHLNLGAFDLVGHADANIGKNANQSLSDKRASAVKAYLATAMKANGATNLHLSTSGKSDAQPVASNKSTAGLAQNRRVDISLPTP